MIAILLFACLVGAFPLSPKDCPAVGGSPKYAAPIVAKGFTARVVISGVTRPRSMTFDKDGNLLVLQNRVEVTAYTMKNEGGCIKSTGKNTVVKASMGPGENVSSPDPNLIKH
jgi:hypothetical protein